MTGQEILALPMPSNDADAGTVRDYLKALLNALWLEEESFSGKRPFGNSGWQSDVYIALIRGGGVEGSVDDEGDWETDEKAADAVVLSAIAAL